MPIFFKKSIHSYFQKQYDISTHTYPCHMPVVNQYLYASLTNRKARCMRVYRLIFQIKLFSLENTVAHTPWVHLVRYISQAVVSANWSDLSAPPVLP